MNTTHLHRAIVLALAAPFALAACGGGSGGMVRGATPAPVSPPPPPPSTPPPPPDTLCPMPITGDCVVTTAGLMLNGRDSSNALIVRTGDAFLGLVGSTFRFASGTRIEYGRLSVGSGSAGNVSYYNPRTVLHSDVTVEAQGTLGMVGEVVGNIDNAGTVDLHGTIRGNLVNAGRVEFSAAQYGDPVEIAGDFSQTPAGTLAFALAPSDWDSPATLSIGGRAMLGGTLLLQQYTDAWGPYPLPAARAHQILHADGGVFGTFDRWTSPGLFIEGALRYGTNDVWFDLSRISVQAAMAGQGFGGITLASAGNLDRALAGADHFAAMPSSLSATQARFLRSANRLLWLADATQAARSLNSLAGSEHARLATDAQQRASAAAGELALQAGTRAMDGLASRWSRPLANGSIDGYDQWLGPRTLLGGSVARETAMASGASSNEQRASLYLHHRGARWLGTVVASAGRGSALLQRRIDLADGRSHVAGAQRRFDVGQLHAELMRPLPLAGGDLQPYAALDAGLVRGSGFLEQGDTGFELSSGGGALHQLGATLGLRYARDGRIGGQRVRLLAELQQTRQLHAGGQWQAAFLGVPDAAFDLRDWSQPRTRSAQLSLQGGTVGGWEWAFGGQHGGNRFAPASWQLRFAHAF